MRGLVRGLLQLVHAHLARLLFQSHVDARALLLGPGQREERRERAALAESLHEPRQALARQLSVIVLAVEPRLLRGEREGLFEVIAVQLEREEPRLQSVRLRQAQTRPRASESEHSKAYRCCLRVVQETSLYTRPFESVRTYLFESVLESNARDKTRSSRVNVCVNSSPIVLSTPK